MACPILLYREGPRELGTGTRSARRADFSPPALLSHKHAGAAAVPEPDSFLSKRAREGFRAGLPPARLQPPHLLSTLSVSRSGTDRETPATPIRLASSLRSLPLPTCTIGGLAQRDLRFERANSS